jgi:hypothetical protein
VRYPRKPESKVASVLGWRQPMCLWPVLGLNEARRRVSVLNWARGNGDGDGDGDGECNGDCDCVWVRRSLQGRTIESV